MTKLRLIRLPNGTLVNPELIQIVMVLKEETWRDRHLLNRVVVITDNLNIEVECPSYQDAESLRDRIEVVVNEGKWDRCFSFEPRKKEDED